MTLITSVITNQRSYMICDKMHSLDGSKDSPAKATAIVGNTTYKITAPKIRINTGTKIFKVSDVCCLGGAGDYDKIQEFIKSITSVDETTIIEHTRNYYKSRGSGAPDQMLILSQQNGISCVDAFYKNTDDELFSFNDCNFALNKTNLGVIAIGSGGPLFLCMYNHVKQRAIAEYKEAVSLNAYSAWEKRFLEEIKALYESVSRYDDAVSAEIEMVVI